MEVRFGHLKGQETVDEFALERELDSTSPIRFFIDTIDEESDIRHFFDKGFEYIVIRIPASEYNQQENKFEFVKEKIQDALQVVL